MQERFWVSTSRFRSSRRVQRANCALFRRCNAAGALAPAIGKGLVAGFAGTAAVPGSNPGVGLAHIRGLRGSGIAVSVFVLVPLGPPRERVPAGV